MSNWWLGMRWIWHGGSDIFNKKFLVQCDSRKSLHQLCSFFAHLQHIENTWAWILHLTLIIYVVHLPSRQVDKIFTFRLWSLHNHTDIRLLHTHSHAYTFTHMHLQIYIQSNAFSFFHIQYFHSHSNINIEINMHFNWSTNRNYPNKNQAPSSKFAWTWKSLTKVISSLLWKRFHFTQKYVVLLWLR